jgi:Na+(H+)/acetate symporter ActP
MSFSAAAWLVIVLAVAAANLPFVNERLFVVGPARAEKSLAWRLLELIVFYAATIGVGLALEARLGQIQPQRWEFYVAMASLFLTLAFPGFVWRYLRRGR